MDQNDVVKITNMVYGILNFLPDSDPLKNRAKEKALEILEGYQKKSSQLGEEIILLENYLKIGLSQGWINNMNFLIITKEYQLIKSGFDKQIPNNKLQVPKDIPAKRVLYHPVDNKGYSKRQSKILEILNKREKAQVGDLIKELPKVTKRTIRRDLDDLLKRGKILRVGEWNQVFYQKMS